MGAINQTYIVADSYADMPVHRYLIQLLSLLEYRQEVAKKRRYAPLGNDKDYISLLEDCNNRILNVLNIPIEKIENQ